MNYLIILQIITIIQSVKVSKLQTFQDSKIPKFHRFKPSKFPKSARFQSFKVSKLPSSKTSKFHDSEAPKFQSFISKVSKFLILETQQPWDAHFPTQLKFCDSQIYKYHIFWQMIWYCSWIWHEGSQSHDRCKNPQIPKMPLISKE